LAEIGVYISGVWDRFGDPFVYVSGLGARFGDILFTLADSGLA